MKDGSIRCLETAVKNLNLASDAMKRGARYAGSPESHVISSTRYITEAAAGVIRGLLEMHRRDLANIDRVEKVLELSEAIAVSADNEGFRASAQALRDAANKVRTPSRTDPDTTVENPV